MVVVGDAAHGYVETARNSVNLSRFRYNQVVYMLSKLFIPRCRVKISVYLKKLAAS